MATKQRLEEQEMRTDMKPDAGEQALGPAAIASAASVGLAWYYFFLKGDRQRGLFVGLWPPTILAFASYFNQRRMREQLDTLTQPASSIRDAIDSIVK